jgi:pimeloyl-ACP methyl ester carboxylesterase
MNESSRAARVARGARRAARAVGSPVGLRGSVIELATLASRLATYPLGMRGERARAAEDRYRVADLPPLHRGLVISDVEAAATPILLVHGLVDNRSAFALLKRSLRRRGFGRVVCLNYSVLTHDVPAGARHLATAVERVCEETGYERLHIIGHSLGGLIARYYVQRLNGDARVHTLVTLGTPHGGTRAAHLLPVPVVRQLRPGSSLLTELAEPAPGLRTRFVAFYSDLDQMIVPKRAGRLDHPDLAARNVLLRGVGHLSLPHHGRVVHEIATPLAHLDAAGHTVTAGVTPIGTAPTPTPTPTPPGTGPAKTGWRPAVARPDARV